MSTPSKTRAWTLFLFAILWTARATAGGFLIYEHGAAATGMADARSALADDPSALYYSPAGIAELPGLQLSLGATGIVPVIHYQAAGPSASPRGYTGYRDGRYVELPVNDGENSTDAKLRGFTPIHLYASYRLEKAPLAFGLSLNNPFGLGTFWPGGWDGRFIATETEIQTFFLQPVVALDLARLLSWERHVRLSFAAGYQGVYGTARLAKRIDLRVGEALSLGEAQGGEGEMRLLGDAVGHGFVLALRAEFPRLFAFGLTVRSAVRLPFSGEASFSFNPAGARTLELARLVFPEHTTGRVAMVLPWNLNLGVAFLGLARFTLAADVYVAFFESYDQLEVTFDCVEEGRCSDTLNGDPIRKDWGKSIQLSLGAEYRPSDSIAVRAGFGLVSSPVPADTYDPSLPDGMRTLLALGGGWRGERFGADIAYMLAFWKGEKDNTVGSGDLLNPEGRANGTYTTLSHILALTLSARF